MSEEPPSSKKDDVADNDSDNYESGDDDSDLDLGLGDVVDGASGGAEDNLIRQMLQMRLNAGQMPKKDLPKVLDEVSFDGVISYLKSGKVKNIITMAGAGISTSAGIPDFRSPGTGLYDNLQKYNLPDPQAIFDIQYFRQRPEPFFMLAKELYPGSFDPTPSHFFVKLLEEKGLLLRHYTQNIDTLERIAGISGDKLVEAHGAFHSNHCINKTCRKEHSQEWMKEQIFNDIVASCDECNALVKPDIVFFGESLPDRFHRLLQVDFPKCDLLIIMGTSLTVHPFASLIDEVGPSCPRLLLNMTKAGEGGGNYLMHLLGRSEGLDFDSENCYRDVAKLGPCDDSCWEIATEMGWKDDLQKLVHSASKVEHTNGTDAEDT